MKWEGSVLDSLLRGSDDVPTRHTARIPPPKGWEELEILVWDLFRCIWKDPYATRHGRSGQRQNGVDVYGHPDRGLETEGVQVKGRDSGFGGAVTEAELRDEAEKAKSFEPNLRHFTLVTSAQRDAAIQRVARALTQENSIDGLFGVDIWGWEDVEERLAGLPNLMQMHYPQFERPGDSETTDLLQSIVRSQQEEAEHALIQDRPRFEMTGSSVTNTESRFTPGFKCKHSTMVFSWATIPDGPEAAAGLTTGADDPCRGIRSVASAGS